MPALYDAVQTARHETGKIQREVVVTVVNVVGGGDAAAADGRRPGPRKQKGRERDAESSVPCVAASVSLLFLSSSSSSSFVVWSSVLLRCRRRRIRRGAGRGKGLLIERQGASAVASAVQRLWRQAVAEQGAVERAGQKALAGGRRRRRRRRRSARRRGRGKRGQGDVLDELEVRERTAYVRTVESAIAGHAGGGRWTTRGRYEKVLLGRSRGRERKRVG